MRALLGIFRLAIAFPVIAVGATLIIIAALFPFRLKGIGLAAWIATLVAHIGVLVFNVRFSCSDPEKLYQHRGLVFPNHISYFDILILLRVLPMRFLSKQAIRSWPFIGWAAVAIGTVFVDRGDKQSRTEARSKLAQATQADPFPSVVLFPEGRIGPARSLQPFRHGAFEVAIDGSVPYLTCVIMYDRPEVMAWGDESFLQAFWRLACWPGPIEARLTPLTTVHPHPGHDATQLAADAHRAMAAVLGVQPQM